MICLGLIVSKQGKDRVKIVCKWNRFDKNAKICDEIRHLVKLVFSTHFVAPYPRDCLDPIPARTSITN